VNKELYNVYVERRKSGYSSKDAVTSARYRLTERAKVALRGWDFDGELVLSRTRESLAWASANNHYGYTVAVFSALDYDGDKLEGVCSTVARGYAHLDVQPGQRVVSHEEGGTFSVTWSSRWRTTAWTLRTTARRAWPNSRRSSGA
jgi:hypothetical protein